MSTTTDLTEFKINYLTQAQYDEALEDGQINSDELYLTPVGDMPTIFISTAEPTSADGEDGDVWLMYEE